MAWKIDRDYISTKDDPTNAIGTAQGTLTGDTFTFTLFDDDGEPYYRGVADLSAAEDDEAEGGLYQAWEWGMYYAGATELRMDFKKACELGLSSSIMADKLDNQGRVSIYA